MTQDEAIWEELRTGLENMKEAVAIAEGLKARIALREQISQHLDNTINQLNRVREQMAKAYSEFAEATQVLMICRELAERERKKREAA